MDAAGEESLSKPSQEEEQDSATAFDASQEHPITAQQCDKGLQNLPEGGEIAAPPLITACGEDEKDLVAGEMSTSMENRDEAQVVKEKDNSVEEIEGMKGVGVGVDMGEHKDTVLSEEAGVTVKNKEEEITDLADESCEMELIEAENKVVVNMGNLAPEVKVEDSVVLKMVTAEKENDIGMPDTIEKKDLSMVNEFGMEDVSMKVNDGVEKREVSDVTDVSDMALETKKVADETDVTDMAVKTMKAEEEGDETVMQDKAVESEEKVLGTEVAEMTDVLVTRSEKIEADGVGVEDKSRELDNKAEVVDKVNVSGMVDATPEEEGADGDGAEEEALEAEETEAVNESDFAAEEADVPDITEDIEAAEEAEEMEVAEDQSRSVSGGKRKRGKNSKSTGKVPARKKLEEDVCFICFDGGNLVLCDRRGCPKAYHPSCVNHDEAFFQTKGKWNCGWHLCSYCAKNAYFMCYTCTFSLCKGCTKNAVIFCVRGNKGFCEACMRIVMLIEQSEQGNKDTGQVDFDDKNSWEYLFKDYYIDLKGKLSLTYDELAEAKNPWKGSDALSAKADSPDELYDANDDKSSHSDSSSEDVEISSSKQRKAKKQLKSRSKKGDSRSKTTMAGAKGLSADASSEWASKELLEFVMHMQNGDKSVLSQFDVQALLLEYIKRNKLRDPRRKSQIICDARLQNLFGKPRVGHFEMLKLLESHFLLKEDSQAEDLQGSVVDTEVSHLEGDGNSESYQKAGKDKRRKTHKKGDSRGPQSNLDDYAAIDNHNINLIYLRRNLVEELLEDMERFHDKVVGSFVRIRISGSSQKQDLYRLVQVVGTCKAAEPYKVGKKMTDTLLEILNLNKTEIVSIDIISNQEFSEDECNRLRQSIKCGLINRLTVGDIQEKALMLQTVRVKDWLETEIVRLSHLRDRASENGRRKELRECVEKLQLLKTPEERQRRLDEVPEIHADPNMDPSHESEEETDDKRQENYTRPRGTAFGWKGGETTSPRRGGSSLNDSWSGTRNYPHVSRELSRNLSNKGFSTKGDDVPAANVIPNDVQSLHCSDRELHLSNSWERPKLSSGFQNGAEDTHPVGSSSPFSTALSEASSAPSSTQIALPVVINEAEKMWHYQDPSGKVQGPFSVVQLRKWNNTGYFPADLRIWRTTENQDESILLTDALAGKFSKELSIVDKAFSKAQIVQDLHSSSSCSGKPDLPAHAIGQVGGRPTFDQNSGINSVVSRHAPLTVDVPSNAANGLGSDAVIRNESTNLPSPTPQTTLGGTKEQAFEKWSPTLQSADTILGNPFTGVHGGLQAPGVMIPENMLQNAVNGLSSQHGITLTPKSDNGMFLGFTDASQVHAQAAAPAPVQTEALTNTIVDFNTSNTAMQNPVVSGHNFHPETQAWGSGLVPKPEMAGSTHLQGGEPQAWGAAPSQRVEPNNSSTLAAQPPPHGHWVDTSSVQSSAPFSSGNPIGNFPMPGFSGMTTSEPWRPPTSNNQTNIQPPGLPNMTWGMGVSENQNAGWGLMPANQSTNWIGALPANMNPTWMTGQGPASGNTNPGWVGPSQGPSMNAANWGAPGQGPSNMNPNANASWAVPGQAPAGVNANPGWAASAGNQGMAGGEQSHNRDRFPKQGDHVPRGSDAGYSGGKPWSRQSSFRGGGGSSRPPSSGQRGVCNFYKNGHCKKGSNCDYLHI